MSNIVFVENTIDMKIVKTAAEQRFGDMVKAVIDIDKKVMAIGGELHADEEALLLDHGSEQSNVWGINIYPDLAMPDAVEREVQDESIRKQIIQIVKTLIPDLL